MNQTAKAIHELPKANHLGAALVMNSIWIETKKNKNEI